MNNPHWLGIDIGSTTVKLALVNPDTNKLIYHKYLRHQAKQRQTTASLLKELQAQFPDLNCIPVFCGSGSRELAEEMESSYIQEVVANSIAVRCFYPETRVSIELGGQDAKVTFFHFDQASGQLIASDMRMNGSCAGGTGAFLDEVASILKIDVEDLNGYASRGKEVYDISGRCGVFAKSDIQPLLNQGVDREDLALSTFHAIAKQTIGGLAQGLEIHPPIIFEGGPLTFNPRLIKVFAERLNLSDNQIILPENPEITIAYGAALSVESLFPHAEALPIKELAAHQALKQNTASQQKSDYLSPFFPSGEEQQSFSQRHQLPPYPDPAKYKGKELNVYLGIDAGSTTSKFVLLDKEENLIDCFYSRNEGEPLKVIQKALLDLKKKYDDLNIKLNILAAGTTGYGEKLFAKAFRADYHTVETVAHSEAALKYFPGASFILDIGGQDMKAIFLGNDIVTDITLNEACSAGCGSFLENFASSLEIPVQNIASMAFNSRFPSRLGSRCTVFMNSSIITEQKNGKTTDDIMAGLCYSIIENVFTKVIRLSNLKILGERIVVQGGTFKNDAVLRAMELFTGKEVVRAPFPGEMGAIGIALLSKKHHLDQGGRGKSSFLSWQEIADFSYTTESGLLCPFCSNHCSRTRIQFTNGDSYITGNRCERGEVMAEADGSEAKDELLRIRRKNEQVKDLFKFREKLIFQEQQINQHSPLKDITIGIPRMLDFWNSYPFWNSLLRSLGFKVVLSSPSSKKLFEKGLPAIPSDTICFPAKLAHGHIEDLISKKVDRIFMPIMNRMLPENTTTKSVHACAVVKGYPMVLQISHEPQEKHGIAVDSPVFHWVDESSRENSLIEYFAATFALPKNIIKLAILEGVKAQERFLNTLQHEGKMLMEKLEASPSEDFAVILAGRPYHSDPLINHKLSEYFTREGVPVFTLDSLPGIWDQELSSIRAELTINFHVRMFAGARYAATHPRLEYVQIVSFGCGHDAVISDEISRLLKENAGKNPLMIKMDESDAAGPIHIRVKSFLQTIRARRIKGDIPIAKKFKHPYEIAYNLKHKKEKTILVPNVSVAFAKITSAALSQEGYKVEPLPLAGELAQKLGKKYVHNDMCYPAQINIGEFLAVLDKGDYDPDSVILALAKAQCDCRLAHYAMMARQALDDAGYPQVPIVTTDENSDNLHADFKLSVFFQLRMLWGLTMMDALEDLRRKVRPYEIKPGEANRVFDQGLEDISQGFNYGIRAAFQAYKKAVDNFCAIEVKRMQRKPRVFIIGEFLLNFHPGSNNFIEDYLEKNGMEVIMPHLFYNIHREMLLEIDQGKEYHVRFPILQLFMTQLTERYVRHVLKKVEEVQTRHPFYEKRPPLREIAERAQHIIDKTFTSGEGWMIAGEILHYADHGVDSFLILQPFGCLPNHVTGRGLVKRLKKEKPDIQILALDYDPDTSTANVENRLQMLIINAREKARLAKDSKAPKI